MDVRDFSPILETIASDYSFSRSLAIARVQKTQPGGFFGVLVFAGFLYFNEQC